MQKYVKDSTGLEANEFDIAIKADVKDEAKVRVTLINKSDKKGKDYFTEVTLFDAMDKTKILSDPSILYNVVTKNMEQAKLDENKAKVTLSYSTPTATEADDFSNTLSMINPNKTQLSSNFRTDVATGVIEKGSIRENIANVLQDVFGGFGKVPFNELVEEQKSVRELYEKALKKSSDFVQGLIDDTTEEYYRINPELRPKEDDKQSSLLDQINPISTANASVLDESQVGEFIPSNQTTGENVTMEGNTLEEKTANMIATQEGFSSTPYKDGSDRSVGYGFFLPALEPDEKALIKDINNVTKEEGAAVLKLKVQKIGNYLDKEIQGFTNLPEKAQSAIISMGYQ